MNHELIATIQGATLRLVPAVRVVNVNHSLRRAVCMADHRPKRRDADGLPARRVRRVWVEVVL